MPDTNDVNPKLKFSLGGKPVVYDLQKEVEIDGERLNSCIIEQPTKFAYIATVHAGYKGAAEGAKVKLDLVSSKMDALIRQAAAEGGEKITEAVVASRIKQSNKYLEAMQAYEELSNIERQLSVAVEAFRQRKDMLITLASNMRAEMDNQLSLKRESYQRSIGE
jgi:hypothetical protein